MTTVRTKLRCPCCTRAMAVIESEEPVPGMMLALLGSGARASHAEENPDCVANKDGWIRGWDVDIAILTEEQEAQLFADTIRNASRLLLENLDMRMAMIAAVGVSLNVVLTAHQLKPNAHTPFAERMLDETLNHLLDSVKRYIAERN